MFLCFLKALSLAATTVANDPTRISVGARPLGMGKAYVALADDINSVFINPAGLSKIDNWQATSMQGKFISEVNYLDFAGAYPTYFGNFCIGYVGSNISFNSPAVTLESSGGVVRIIPSTTEGVSYNYNNNVTLLSYGTDLKGLLNQPFFDHLSFGATVKLFSQQLSGPGISGGSGTGYDLDVGLIYQPNSILKAGLVVQNALPASMGGKIVWDSGSEEDLPAVIKPGLSLKILGPQGLRQIGKQTLTLNLDGDLYWNRPNLPSLLHLGLEWSPTESIDIRAGIDQDIIGTGGGGLSSSNNLTAGIGLYLNGYRFDYAYHQYFGISDNDTHYFSLSYGLWKTPPPAKVYLKLLEPTDEAVVYSANQIISGQVLDDDAKKITVNGQTAEISTTKLFSIAMPLELKKNSLVVIAYNQQGKELERKTVRILRLATFEDVASNYWAKKPIGELASLGIISGYPDGTFRPENKITRAELVTLLAKIEDISAEADNSIKTTPFRDVKPNYWAAPYILYSSENKVVTGYPDQTFRPGYNVNRVEGVTILARFAQLDLKQPIRELSFPDLPGRHWALREVNAAKSAGLLKYLEDQDFKPAQNLTRAEVVEMLAKTEFSKKKLADLLDWNKGY
ncbi:hypothetical protein A2291_00450 [candidate division WOR-1 bacterium RIFOXYB2_FULL_42_35]|uniref:SLH domain-containing protein n=1 Tax=candidate division WOR-1 bacterium RIFOXYC2_FULL_41_25 TaxID=1802586 RepID=A0A1F4TP18_UNCSA|nr:MAG: hypothetical protein A2247_08015 [candidate division WOR-1 bacterium RIFOXYA2_FULL_41_14]OGC23703.1 MAG: hypothetical protein A2291_00450 [candidate division WOR-1 bacterium RIFOXYB2_FULL_42_35]OGC34416.1 MAG: hypothetical protein A2462_01215 [candidate division WOR-1 bacterium RIFOXYC2_FULL_41_25]OGC43266.1 MAG: hypothetical protein A2548_01560 [candidate division WOR-1 bacterium RIFOXYD2_FULL_41_8]